MQDKDLQARIYKYYDLIRQELGKNVKSVKLNLESKSGNVTEKSSRPANKNIKWKSKGY